jgi:hypothetical protein
MKTLQSIYNKITDKTELTSQKVELATVDDIKYQLKFISGLNDQYNKKDAIVQKSVAALNAAYKDIILNKDYPKKAKSTLDKLQAALVKQTSDLGIDYKQLPAFKELMDAYSFADQINDSITNAIGAVQSIGK